MQGSESITIFGAGTWGITLACLLHKKGHCVRAWEYDPRVVEQLRRTRVPINLPHLNVPAEIQIAGDLEGALAESRHWVIAVPSYGVRALAKNLAAFYAARPPETITVCAKGIEAGTGLTLTRVVDSELSCGLSRVAVLSGPSHSEEVSRDIPTTVVSASESEPLARRVQAIFNTSRFRVYTGTDVLGVELGAALKNVIAIASGVCDGMGFGDNTRAALITRGLAEMIRLGVKMGARRDTFAGLTGMGDLIVTACSRHSRNRNFGELLGRGVPADEARARIGMEIEGIYAALSALQLAQRHGIDMPISREVYAVLYEAKAPADAVRDLLARDPKPEIYE